MSLNRRAFLGGALRASALTLVPGFLGACAHQGAPLLPTAVATAHGGSSWFHSHFGIDDALLQRVMSRALARGGDFCDLYFEHSLSNSIRLEDGQINTARTNVELGCGVRVVQGIRFGYAFTEELTPEGLLKAADAAAAIATGAPGAVAASLRLRTTSNLYPIKTPWDNLGIEERMPLLSRVNEQIASLDKRIVKSTVSLGDGAKRILVVTSDGTMHEDYQPMAMLYAGAVAEENGRRERSSFASGGRVGLEYFDAGLQDRVARETVNRTVELFEAVTPPAGEYPLVLGPGPSGILLHEAIGHGIEADFNRKNISVFANKLGKKIAIPEITVVDSGLHPHTRGAINIDDEGQAAQETVLVEKGVLNSYLHDRISAAWYKVPSTGSGRRESFHFPPMPRMRNTYMLPGSESPQDILASVKRGIYAESFTNGQVKIGEGSFSFYIAKGRLIEDGKLTAPIKDVNIIGNGPEVLSRITRVGNDLKIDEGGWTCGKDGQSVPVSQGMPTALVSSITIGGSRG